MFPKRVKALIVGVAIILAGCAVDLPTPSLVDPTNFITYVHPTGVFTLNLPPDWVVNDLSTDTTLDVEFSAPNDNSPLVAIVVVNADTLMGESAGAIDTAPPVPDLNALATQYERARYVSGGAFQEIAREPQPDGSMRIKFLLNRDGKVTAHNDFVQIIGPYFVALRTRLPDDAGQFRTVSRVINTMTINPLSAWATETETTEPGTPAAVEIAPVDVVGFSNLNAWVGTSGGFQIAGQVVNRSPVGLEFIRIQAQLYDGQGNVIAQRDDFVSADQIIPEQYAPFSIVFDDGLPPGVVRYELHAAARYADLDTSTFYGPENFDVTSQSEIDMNGLLIISGSVFNKGSQPSSLVKVIVVLFDEQQKVIGTDTALVDQPVVASGESATYSVAFFELGGTPSTFLISAQGVIRR